MSGKLRLIVAGAIVLVLAVLCYDVGRLVLAPTRAASIDAVRIRNAMVSQLGDVEAARWTPSSIPADW